MKSIVVIISIFLVYSCNQSPQENKSESKDTSETVIKALPDSTSDGDQITESYRGVLPCADCSGLEIIVALSHKPNYAEGNYDLKQKYMDGTPQGKAQNNAAGEWTTLRGNNADPDATIVELMKAEGETSMYIERVGENLLLLDINQNEIKSGVNYTLKKVETDGATKINFIPLKNYFVRNTVKVTEDPTYFFIRSQAEFDSTFGAAKTMNNKITQPDFSSERVIAITGAPQKNEVTISIDSVKQKADQLFVYFHSNSLKELTYEMQPVAMFSVPNSLNISSVIFYSFYDKVKALTIK